ncbi:hypothetical protein JCM1840_000539 [Sporobolomyces johnsonii]
MEQCAVISSADAQAQFRRATHVTHIQAVTNEIPDNLSFPIVNIPLAHSHPTGANEQVTSKHITLGKADYLCTVVMRVSNNHGPMALASIEDAQHALRKLYHFTYSYYQQHGYSDSKTLRLFTYVQIASALVSVDTRPLSNPSVILVHHQGFMYSRGPA